MHRGRSGVALLVATGLSFAVLSPVLPAMAAAGDPTITTAPPSVGRNRTITWSFTGGGQTSCRLSGPGSFDTSYVDCNNSANYDLAGQPDGVYTFAVRNQPASSNNGEVGTTGSYELDTVAPVTITSSPPSPANVNSVSWSFTAETGATTACQLSPPGPNPPGFVPCASPVGYALDTDGTYIFTVQATDNLGNTGPAATSTFTRDSQPPQPPTITAEPPSPGTTASVAWSFTAPGSASTSCQITRDGVALDPFAPCVSATVYTLPGDGTYVFSVRALDGVGNQSDPATSSSFVLDLLPPPPPVITGGPGAVGRTSTPTWSFTAEAGSTTSCQLSPSGPNPVGFVACSSPVAYTLNADGAYTFSVRATDALARSGSPAISAYVLDRTAPAPPVITDLASPQAVVTPTWTFAAEAGAVPSCQLRQGLTLVSTGCSSPSTASYTLPADGTYTFSVWVADTAGNVSAVATSADYVLDTRGPSAPMITAGPPAVGRTTAPQWTFTAEAGSSTSCQLTAPGSTAPGFGPCSSPMSYVLAVDGAYTFSVRATDAAGNTGAVAIATYTLDRGAPSLPVITPVPSPGANATPTWVFTVEDGATATCTLLGAATVLLTGCSSGTSATYTLSSDGPYTFSVFVTDAAGNSSATATSGYLLDRTAPGQPAVSGPGSPGRVAAVTWIYSLEAGATASCQLTRDGSVVDPLAACPFDPTATAFNAKVVSDLTLDGTYVLSVLLTDAAGNRGPPGSAAYVLDRRAPVVPTLLTFPLSPGNDSTPTWTFSGPELGATNECELRPAASLAPPAFRPCDSPTSDAALLTADGGYQFSVRTTDAAGNVGPAARQTYVLDTAPPAPPTITAGPTGTGTATTVIWRFTVEPGATPFCQLLQGRALIVAPTACASPMVQNLPSDGDYTFSVYAVDRAGNAGQVTTATFTRDTGAPDPPIFVGIPTSPAALATVTWGFSSDPTNTLACQLSRDGTILTAFAPCSSGISATYRLGSDGAYVFSVRATDPAGNTGASASSEYILDTTAPGAPAIGLRPTSGTDPNATWFFTAEPGSTTFCRLTRDTIVLADWAPCSGSRSYDLSNEPPGMYVFSVRAVDVAGNVGLASTVAHGWFPLARRPAEVTTLGPPPPERPSSLFAVAPGMSERSIATGPAVALRLVTDRAAPAFLELSPVPVPAPTELDASEQAAVLPGPPPSVGAAAGVADTIRDVGLATVKKTAFPFLLLVVVLLFLLIQDRIDRRDPKLALAPVYRDPDLDFAPPPSRRTPR